MTDQSFNDMVSEAAYNEFNKLGEIYQRTHDIEGRVALMQPGNLYTILKNAATNLSELGKEAFDFIYDHFYYRFDAGLKLQLLPSEQLHLKIKKSLLHGIEPLEVELVHYENVYDAAFTKLCNLNSGKKTLGATVIGGAIGSLLGPVGAIAGGIAAGSMSEEASFEEASRHYNRLQSEFLSVTSSTNNFLETMANRLLSNVSVYNQMCDGSKPYFKNWVVN